MQHLDPRALDEAELQQAALQLVHVHAVVAGMVGADVDDDAPVAGPHSRRGSLANTGVATDLALNGDGFFTVKGTVEGVTSNFYTRAGQFVINADGYLVNPNGLKVQGYAGNPDGTFESSVSSLRAPTSAIQPHATESMVITANLDASAAVPLLAWDDQDPANTSNFSTSLTVYDSLGSPHALDIFFVKTGANTWDYHVLASGDDVDPAQPGLNVEVGAGDLEFTTNGELDTFNEGTPISVDFIGATAGQAVALNLGTSVTAGGTGLDGITQFASPSNVSSQKQDGYASGDFAGVAVDGRGVVSGLYTNGQQHPDRPARDRQVPGQRRPRSAPVRACGSRPARAARPRSVPPAAAAAPPSRRARSKQSNVDLAEEFVGLIQHQRSFSANSKTITTADEMLQELINIKR